MGVSVDVWRALCGSFNARAQGLLVATSQCNGTSQLDGIQLGVALFALLNILLLIGNIEPNPGPTFTCVVCKKILTSVEDHVKHQQQHMNEFNFQYRCPFSCTLNLSFKSLKHLTAHIQFAHKSAPKAGSYKCQVTGCTFSAASKIDLNEHAIKDHLARGVQILCVPGGCQHAPVPFSKVRVYRTHLSQYHKGWQSSNSADTNCEPGGPSLDQGEVSFGTNDAIDYDDYSFPEEPHDTPADVPASEFEDDDAVVKHIARFYLMLQASSNIPEDTLQKICEYLRGISEVIQARFKARVKTCLQKYHVSETDLNHLLFDLQSCDPLYATHHTFMPGPNLSSQHYREQFYETYFGYRDPLEVGLSVDRKSDLKVQYIPIRSTVEEMLQDPSVQKQVDDSFRRSSVDGRLSDYHDGSVMKERNELIESNEVIDVIVFQDAFSVVCPIGSAKNKFKILGTYITLGNLKAWARSMLTSMRLVLLFREKILQVIQSTHDAIAKKGDGDIDRAFGQKKCFGSFLSDLRTLIKDGVMYKGRMVHVRLCHVLGDNLGSHFIGGFRQYFTSGPVCRFCPMTLEQFKEECKQGSQNYIQAFRSRVDYARCALRAKLLSKTHVSGIKFTSILEGLGDYHACDGLPPCLAHDYFEGVASEDLTLILKDLVRKGWFSYKILDKKIANFIFKDADSTNKPAPVNKKQKKKERTKLGGAAVQNWTLIRFLPFFIQDHIKDTNDPSWQFYLCLKELCEVICAPTFTVSDLNYLKHSLIPSYIEKRVEIFGSDSLISKHHFICHYPDLILKYGPLFYLWTLRFESFHSYFKTVARHNNNFINIERSLAKRYQLRMCFLSSGDLLDKGNFVANPSSIGNLSPEEALLLEPLLTSNSISGQAISIDGLNYKVGDCLILNKHEDSQEILMGKIQKIVYDGNDATFLMKKVRAVFRPSYGIYSLQETLNIELVCALVSKLDNPRVQSTYDFLNSESFTLKQMVVSDDH